MQQHEQHEKAEHHVYAVRSPVTALRGESCLKTIQSVLHDAEREAQNRVRKNGDQREIKQLAEVLREEIARGLEQEQNEKKRRQRQKNCKREFRHHEEKE